MTGASKLALDLEDAANDAVLAKGGQDGHVPRRRRSWTLRLNRDVRERAILKER